MKRLILLVLFAYGFFCPAQTTFREQAARLQNINAALLDLRPSTAPVLVSSGRLELVLDLLPQPSVDTTIGRKSEPVDPPNLVPKLRGRYLFRSGLMLGGAWAPGIEFQDYEADYVSFEAAYRRRWLGLDFSIRATYSDGEVVGAITESKVKDQFEFTNKGLDLSVGRTFFDHLRTYAFVGSGDLESRLLVKSDGALVDNTSTTPYGGIGVAWDLGRQVINFEQNFTDDYLRHVALSLTYKF